MTKTTTVDLRDLSEPFVAWRAQRGISRSLAMRQLVASALGDDRQLSLLSPPRAAMWAGGWNGGGGADSGPPHRFMLRLTQIQRDHLKARAAQTGMSCGRYVIAAITARDSDAIAGQDVVRALLQSNDLLAQAMRSIGAGRGQRLEAPNARSVAAWFVCRRPDKWVQSGMDNVPGLASAHHSWRSSSAALCLPATSARKIGSTRARCPGVGSLGAPQGSGRPARPGESQMTVSQGRDSRIAQFTIPTIE